MSGEPSQPIVDLRKIAWVKGYDVEKAPGPEERWWLIRAADREAATAPDGAAYFTTEQARSFLESLPAQQPGSII